MKKQSLIINEINGENCEFITGKPFRINRRLRGVGGWRIRHWFTTDTVELYLYHRADDGMCEETHFCKLDVITHGLAIIGVEKSLA